MIQLHGFLRSPFVLTAAAGLAILPACGDDGARPEGPGTMNAAVSDDNGAAASAVRESGTTTATRAAFTGTFSGEMQVLISADGETWVDLGSPSSVSVALQTGDQAVVHADVEVAAGTYSRVRVVISGATADVDAGSEIGGTTLSSDASISVADGSEFTVDVEMFPFTVDGDTDMTIVIDLNSESWITSETAQSESATAASVQSAVEVETVRS